MFSEVVTVEGHLIDSQVLTRVLDDIMAFGGDFRILEVHVGQNRTDRSHAQLEVRAESARQLEELIAHLSKQGALVRSTADADLQPAESDGVFPDEFFATTNQQTFVRHDGHWVEVSRQEMDCGIRFEAADRTFSCVPIVRVRKGDLIVCGHRGVKVVPFERPRERGSLDFRFPDLSTEKPKNALIKQCARLMVQCKRDRRKLLFVGGPTIVHAGATEHVVKLIERGYVQVLFGGNALAAHDIEYALYGTSLGVYVDQAILADMGHEHTLRAINTVRRCGGIRPAVEQKVIQRGIMHACVRHEVETLLIGSIRDDGPLPEVVTDMVVAQDRMRAALPGLGFALMVATGLHAIATSNLLPAWVPSVCVDINPLMLGKLADRDIYQTIGVVSDCEPFLRELVDELDQLEEDDRRA